MWWVVNLSSITIIILSPFSFHIIPYLLSKKLSGTYKVGVGYGANLDGKIDASEFLDTCLNYYIYVDTYITVLFFYLFILIDIITIEY